MGLVGLSAGPGSSKKSVHRSLRYALRLTAQRASRASGSSVSSWQSMVPLSWVGMVNALFLDAGVVASRVVRDAQRICKALDKEGLQGGWHVKRPVVRHWHMHDPGIQDKPLRYCRYASVQRL